MDMIVAADLNCGIGKKNSLLFSIPEDMKYFREKTRGKAVVMGRKTYLSLPGKAPLKNRTNIVLSGNAEFNPEGFVSVHSEDELFAEIAKYPPDSVMLIGGGAMYTALFRYCRRAYVTWVDAVDREADSFIPDFRALGEWEEESVSEPVESN